MAEDLKNQPNYCCAAYKAMGRAWAIMRDTCAGTLHLRDQGSRYLPTAGHFSLVIAGDASFHNDK